MTKHLKGIIFSIGDVLVPGRNMRNDQMVEQVIGLLQFLLSKRIQPVILANRDVPYAETLIKERVGDIPFFMTVRNHLPKKPTGKAIPYVLDQMGWNPTETAYVGSKAVDMQTAVNCDRGSILFLNAQWFNSETDYGIKFQTPDELAQFVEVFCLGDQSWGFSIIDDSLEYYALGTFSTLKQEFAAYSDDARSAAKQGTGHLDFWTKYLWTKIYFSELYKTIDYITVYPGHKAVVGSIAASIVKEPLEAFSKCFRIEFLDDLIIRHTTATKSQTARTQGRESQINHCNQLNTIHLNPTPKINLGRNKGQQHRDFSLEGKTVLVVDDISTAGYSLEAARVYLKQAKAKRVVLLSWLKTINSDYHRIRSLPSFNPFQPNQFDPVSNTQTYPYWRYVYSSASAEIDNKFRTYRAW